MSEPTLFEQLGGEAPLRRIVNLFVDAVFDDIMIGFLFRDADRERVKQKEYEFAARHLGAAVTYTGRPLREAHAPHPIMGGQFARRLKILEETLEACGAPPAVRDHWLTHTEQLRTLITGDPDARCDPDAARARTLRSD